MRDESIDDSLLDAKLDPKIIDEDLKKIYPDKKDYCVDLSDSLNLTPPGKSTISLGKISKNYQKLVEFYLDSGCGAHVVNDISNY